MTCRRISGISVCAILGIAFLSLLGGQTCAAREASVVPDSLWCSDAPPHDAVDLDIDFDDQGETPALRGYHVEILYPASYIAVDAVTEGGFLAASGDPVAFFWEDDEAGRLEINAAILGTSAGAVGSGTLFTITFTGGSAEGCGSVAFDAGASLFRDVNNVGVSVTYGDGWIACDRSGPVQPFLSSPTHPEGSSTSASSVTVAWSDVADLPAGCGVGVAGYYLTADQSASSEPGPGNYDVYVAAGESTEAQFTLADGIDYYVHVRPYDAVGNAGGVDHYGPFSIDTQPPGDVSEVLAAGGHNEIVLSWTPPADAETVAIYRKAWSYPEFDDAMAMPAAPTSIGDGVLVGEFPVAITQTTETLLETERNYYVYTAFAIDPAGNISSQPAPAGARDWALSYWLGDLDDDFSYDCILGGYDGYIDGADLNAFSAVFGTAAGEGGYCAEMDIGPTSDGLETGYPLTDDEVGFEDLMVFSLAYGNAAPAPRRLMLDEASSRQLVFRLRYEDAAWETAEVVRCVLSVAGNADGFKGVHARVDFDPRAFTLIRATVAHGLSGGSDLFFAGLERDAGDLELNLAALGRDAAIQGDGELIVLLLRPEGASAGTIALRALDVRDVRNQPLLADVTTPHEGVGESLPATVSLQRLDPNPARGATTISFALPEALPVEIELLDISGRCLGRILTEEALPGQHSIDWDGRDAAGRRVPAGLYWVRLRAGRVSTSRSLLIVR